MPWDSKTAKECSIKAHKAKAKYKQDLWDALASGHQRRYNELLGKQFDGEKINENQEKAMDRSERLFKFVQSPKMPVNSDGESKMEIQITTV